MKELISYLATRLADHPEEVEVSEAPGENGQNIQLKVAAEDLNVIVGKHGRTAKAMRSLLVAASAKRKSRYFLEIGSQGGEAADIPPADEHDGADD